MKDYYYQRKQRVVLNGTHSHLSCGNVEAEVPQGSILEPLFFLIYINDLSDGLNSSPKLFSDDTSAFSTVYDVNLAASNLNIDLIKVSRWASEADLGLLKHSRWSALW